MAPDLKQVAALFNDCIETIRNEKHDHLEAMARKWLTEARYAVMRKVEAESVDNSLPVLPFLTKNKN